MHVSYSRSPLKPRAHTSLPASAGRSITSGKRSRTTRLAHSLQVLLDGARELEHGAAAEDLADRLHVAPVVEALLLDVHPHGLDGLPAGHALLARDGREVRGARALLEDPLAGVLVLSRELLARRHAAPLLALALAPLAAGVLRDLLLLLALLLLLGLLLLFLLLLLGLRLLGLLSLLSLRLLRRLLLDGARELEHGAA